jgi:integrase
MAISIPSYLFQRNQIWYFRQRIPTNLVDSLGKSELKVSLKTRDLRVAKPKAWKLAAVLWQFFAKHQSNEMRKKPDDILELITIKDVKVGNVELGDVTIDHQGDAAAERATLNAFLSVIDQSKQEKSSEINAKAPPDSIPQSPKLSTAIGEYIANKRDEIDNESQADEKTIGATEAKLKRLVQVLGDVTINTIMRKDAEKFRNTLLKLPSNMNKLKEYKGLNLTEIIALAPTNTLSVSTVKSYIEVVSTFYKWCRQNQYSDHNPFESLRVKKPKNAKKENEERDPWEPEQLVRMFNNPVFTHHEFKHAYYYWLPLIGLYTGARMNEICQIYCADIKKIDGNLFFRFAEDRPDQKLKNLNSRRLVPVHSKLIELGFESYLHHIKKTGNERLFPTLTHSRDGYSKNASSWFSRYRKKYELQLEGKKQDFHSFRHNVSDFFKQHDIPGTQAAAVLGHADQTITYGRYGKDLQASKLIELVDILDFSDETKNIRVWNHK